jgi:hypothetical protein
MKHSSENQSQEVLAGLVERVTYHNVENGFCVLRAKARGHRDIVTVVGHAATIPNDVVILQDVADVSKARTWLTSNEMKSVMEKSGVLGSPSIRFAAAA